MRPPSQLTEGARLRRTALPGAKRPACCTGARPQPTPQRTSMGLNFTARAKVELRLKAARRAWSACCPRKLERKQLRLSGSTKYCAQN